MTLISKTKNIIIFCWCTIWANQLFHWKLCALQIKDIAWIGCARFWTETPVCDGSISSKRIKNFSPKVYFGRLQKWWLQLNTKIIRILWCQTDTPWEFFYLHDVYQQGNAVIIESILSSTILKCKWAIKARNMPSSYGSKIRWSLRLRLPRRVMYSIFHDMY